MTELRASLAALLVAWTACAVAAQGTPTALIAGCPDEPLAFHRCALEKAKTFVPPRTPGGRPDLQGYWVSRMANPFSVEGVEKDDPLVGDFLMPWAVSPPMIVEPADRRIPYQPWAAALGRRGVNDRTYIDPRTSCGSAGVPRLALQDPSQILQPATGGYVLWLFEDHHSARAIAMDDRARPGDGIKLWNGISTGRWQGNTLVIDITNLNGHNWFDDSGDFYTDTAHLVERLTLIDRDTIHYQVTLADARVYTRPWTMAWALVRQTEPNFEIWEEACLEGERDALMLRKGGLRPYYGESWKRR